MSPINLSTYVFLGWMSVKVRPRPLDAFSLLWSILAHGSSSPVAPQHQERFPSALDHSLCPTLCCYFLQLRRDFCPNLLALSTTTSFSLLRTLTDSLINLFICRLHFPVVSETPFGEASSPWAPQPVPVRSPGTPSWGNLPCAPSPRLGLLIALGTSSPSPGSLLPFWPRQFHVLRQLHAMLRPSKYWSPAPNSVLRALLFSPSQ